MGVLVCFIYVATSKIWFGEAEAERAQRNLVFDLYGNCTAATSLDSDMERLHHPEHRGMSICWLVESVSQKQNAVQQKTSGADSSGGVESDIHWEVTKQDQEVSDAEINDLQ